MKKLQSSPTRRAFLLSIGAGSVAATAALVMRGQQSSSGIASTKINNGQGYQLTAHVQNYYRTAKI